MLFLSGYLIFRLEVWGNCRKRFKEQLWSSAILVHLQIPAYLFVQTIWPISTKTAENLLSFFIARCVPAEEPASCLPVKLETCCKELFLCKGLCRDRATSFRVGWAGGGLKKNAWRNFFGGRGGGWGGRAGGRHACRFLFNFSKVTENAVITIKLLIFFPHLQWCCYRVWKFTIA